MWRTLFYTAVIGCTDFVASTVMANLRSNVEYGAYGQDVILYKPAQNEYYHRNWRQEVLHPNGNSRQSLQGILSSPAVAFLQFGVLVILGGASLVTGIQAATNDRDLSTLRSRFSIVCDAVRVAGAVDGDVSPTPAPITTTQGPQIPDPAGPIALMRINAIIDALKMVDASTCVF